MVNKDFHLSHKNVRYHALVKTLNKQLHNAALLASLNEKQMD